VDAPVALEAGAIKLDCCASMGERTTTPDTKIMQEIANECALKTGRFMLVLL
jgi:hypothetical protein